MTNDQNKQLLQELAAYRSTVENLRARVAELEDQLAAAPHAVQASAIAGAVFDFAGYLTTLPHNEAIHCSEAHEASPMVDAITEWCKRRNLTTDGSKVETWRQAIATHPTQQGLEQFIEQVGDVHFQRCRVGSKDGQIRWDIEFGHYGAEVRGKTLQEAVTKALAAQAKQGGV